MKITLGIIRTAGIPMATAKGFFDQMKWPWGDFVTNGREVSEADFRMIPPRAAQLIKAAALKYQG